MKMFITSDADAQSGIGELVDTVSGPCWRHFQRFDFGDEVAGICVVLVCQPLSIGLKPRVSYSKKERQLYLDVMIDPAEVKRMPLSDFRHMLFDRITNNISTVLAKYRLKEFRSNDFIEALRSWFSEMNK